MQDQLQSTKTKGFLPHVKILPFRSVVHSGEAMRDRVTTVAPTPDDTAIIMYTSGSTGTPKVQHSPVPPSDTFMSMYFHKMKTSDGKKCGP